MKKQLGLIIGMDANTTLQYNCKREVFVAGPSVLQPRKSHTQVMTSVVEEWCIALGIGASNTLEGQSRQDLWTCGTWRSCRKGSQIDYIFNSTDTVGRTRPYSIDHALMKRSDHRPLYGTFELMAGALRRPPRQPSMIGWRPLVAQEYRAATMALIGSGSVMEFQRRLSQIVMDTAGDTLAARARQARGDDNKAIRLGRAAVTVAQGDERRAAVLQLRRAKRKRTKNKASCNLPRAAKALEPYREATSQSLINGSHGGASFWSHQIWGFNELARSAEEEAAGATFCSA